MPTATANQLQKIMCGYATPMSKFSSDPCGALEEAKGDAIAVISRSELLFYAVPAALYEQMVNELEFAQRGKLDLNVVPSTFKASAHELANISNKCVESLTQQGNTNDEW